MSFWSRLVERWRALASSTRWLLVAGSGVVVLCVSVLLAVPAYASRELGERAGQRGLTVEVGRVRFGWGRLWFQNVMITDPQLPGTRAKIDALAVAPTWSSGLALTLHGARLDLVGSDDALTKRLRSLRGTASADARSVAKRHHRVIRADGIAVRWRPEVNAASSATALHLWGVRVNQSADGAAEVAADLVRVGAGRMRGDLRGLELSAELAGSERRIARAEAARVALSVELAADTEEAEPKPSTPAPERAAGSSWSARWSVLKSALSKLTTSRFRSSVVALSIETRRGDEALRIGPSRFALAREGDTVSMEIVPHPSGADTGTALTLRARVPLDARAAELDLSGGPVSLSTLGVREGDFGLVSVREARLEAEAHLVIPSDSAPVSISSKGALENVRLRRPALAPDELSGIRLAWRLDGSVAESGSAWSFRNAELTLGDVRVELAGELRRHPDRASADLRIEVPLASCSALLEAVPRGMAPLLNGVRMEGTFALKGALTYDGAKPLATRTSLKVNNQCRIAEVPAAISPARFRNPWSREVKGADGLPVTIESGPGTADWTPYEGISPFMETAIVVCEDGGFFGHRGIDYSAIENSLRMNLEVGRFLRGGSTVTMQLAKNIYLRKEKTLSRKLQEAVLTLVLEQHLSKHELMELYLNVIEFGPGIYGVRQAARYYFNEEPRELSLGQALYLGSILPAPDRHHFRPDGHVSPGWAQYLKRLMHLAHKIRRITDDELAAGLNEQVVFREPSQLAREPPAVDEGPMDEAVEAWPRSDDE
jgi:hypothetical protein